MKQGFFNNTTITNALTAFGGLPLLILLLLPTHLWQKYQLISVLYLTVIISFIAGISWCFACLYSSKKLLIWAVILSISAWFVMWLASTVQNYTLIWLLSILLLNVAWLVDSKAYRPHPLLRRLRLIGTMTINSLIVLIVLRHFI